MTSMLTVNGIAIYRANLGIIWPRPWPKVEVPVMGIFSDGDLFLSEAQMRDTKKCLQKAKRWSRCCAAASAAQTCICDIISIT